MRLRGPEPSVLYILLTLTFCSISAGADLTVETPKFPRIEFRDVSFQCDDSAMQYRCFKATLVPDDATGEWTDLTIDVISHMANGSHHIDSIKGDRNDRGYITRFYSMIASAYLDDSSRATDVEVRAVEGTLKKNVDVQVYEGILARAQDCLRDYLKTSKLRGLEQRKAIAELIKFGCIIDFGAPARVAAMHASSEFIGWLSAYLVGKDQSASGWIISSGVHQSSLPQYISYPNSLGAK